MRIAFDADGVLTDLEKFQLEYGEKFFKEKYNKEIVNPSGYGIKEIFDCTDEQEVEFWKKNIVFYSLKYPPRIGMKETIRKLVADNNQIYIFTSRIKTDEKGFLGKMMRCFFKLWLKNEKINYDKIEFCSIKNSALEKVENCKKYKIDFIVEDTPENINELSKTTKVICYNAIYNNNIINTDNIYKIDHCYEIYDTISSFYDEEKFRILKRYDKQKLSKTQLIEYYKDLRQYYLSLDSDINSKKTEKFYKTIYPGLKKIFDLKYPYEIENKENIPQNNGVIYVINHRDMIDMPLIMSALGNRPVHLLLKAEFLETPAKGFLNNLGCVFVDRENRDSHIVSKEELIKLILSGSNCIICPEGTRNKTDDLLLEFKLGAVAIAQVTGAPIVPIAITKKFNDYSEKILLKVGTSMNVSVTDDLVEKNKELQNQIKNMLVEQKTKKLV